MMKMIWGFILAVLVAKSAWDSIHGLNHQGMDVTAFSAQSQALTMQPPPIQIAQANVPTRGSSPQPNKYEWMRQTAASMNKQLPQRIGDDRIDAVQAGPGDQFFFIHTLLKLNSRNLDPNTIPAFAAEVKRQACDTPYGQRILALGITVVLLYRGSDGVEVMRISFNSADCATPQGGRIQTHVH